MDTWTMNEAEHAAFVKQVKTLISSSEFLKPFPNLDEGHPLAAIRKCLWYMATCKATISRLIKTMELEKMLAVFQV